MEKILILFLIPYHLCVAISHVLTTVYGHSVLGFKALNAPLETGIVFTFCVL